MHSSLHKTILSEDKEDLSDKILEEGKGRPPTTVVGEGINTQAGKPT